MRRSLNDVNNKKENGCKVGNALLSIIGIEWTSDIE